MSRDDFPSAEDTMWWVIFRMNWCMKWGFFPVSKAPR